MASGDPIFTVPLGSAHFPASAPAEAGSTGENSLLWLYDDTTTESLYFKCRMGGHYDGSSDIKVPIEWKFLTYVGSQVCVWELSIYRVQSSTDTIDAYTFASAVVVSAVESTASGQISYDSVTFTNAQADGVQAGEIFIIKCTRNAGQGTASPGDAELHYLSGEYA